MDRTWDGRLLVMMKTEKSKPLEDLNLRSVDSSLDSPFSLNPSHCSQFQGTQVEAVIN